MKFEKPLQIQVEMDDEPIYIVDANDEDVATIHRSGDRERDMAAANAVVEAMTPADEMDAREIDVGNAGVWISIAGKSVKVRVIAGSLEIDVWETGREDEDDANLGELSIPL